MAIPTYDKFIEPLLRLLAQHPEGLPARDCHEHLASVLGLTDADREALLPSGAQEIYKNRAGWAHDRLKRAGLSSSPKRGFWKLTDQGRAYVGANPGPFSESTRRDLAVAHLSVRLRKADHELPDTPGAEPDTGERDFISPEERLGGALSELRESAQAELLELLGTVSPTFFESIVLDLLHRMGYGASRSDLQRIGGSGDGGIDGIISLDRLGLEKVYVQAKRWQQSVGRPEVQAFYGALAGQKARKGVFITTSSFTSQATEFAKSVDGIVLIDGRRLADLMIDHELGVSSRTIKVPRIDSDYFEE